MMALSHSPPLSLILLILLTLSTCARAYSNDQLCVQIHHGRCVDYHACGASSTLDVCDSPKEVCCRTDSGGTAGQSQYLTAQIPLYMANCPSTVQSSLGNLWVYASEADRALYLYPDLVNEYYDCNRYQMVALRHRARLAGLSLQLGTGHPHSVKVMSDSPHVRLNTVDYVFHHPALTMREDTVFPLLIPYAALDCSAALRVVAVATVEVGTTYNTYNLTAMGGDRPLRCNSTALVANTGETCNALDYYLATHVYQEGCVLRSDCSARCTTQDGVSGLCMDYRQCAAMGALGTEPCTQCDTEASVVCCQFAVEDPLLLPPPTPRPTTRTGPTTASQAIPPAVAPDAFGLHKMASRIPFLGSFSLTFLILCVSLILFLIARKYWRKPRSEYTIVDAALKRRPREPRAKAGTGEPPTPIVVPEESSDVLDFDFAFDDEDDTFIPLDTVPRNT